MGRTTGLAKEQRDTLARLKGAPGLDRFYLAGGSAVAHHLRHRRSRDLDLFSDTPDVDLDTVGATLARTETDYEVVERTDAMLRARLAATAVDFVRYRYPLLQAPSAGPAGFPTAGLLDLATMKLAAISRRGIRRDFWDLHAILATPMTLDDALDAYVRRFGVAESDLYHVLRSLTFFDDAERDPMYPEGLTETRWEEIKATFLEIAPEALRSRR